MKQAIFILTFSFLSFNFLHAQNLPWIKKGMSEREIRQNLSGGEWRSGPDNRSVYRVSDNLLYGFVIDPRKGLTRYMIMGKTFDFNTVLRNFRNLYGEPLSSSSDFYVFIYNLPNDVSNINVQRGANSIDITYVFDDQPIINIVNNTGNTIAHIYLSSSTDRVFRDDILSDSIIKNGETFSCQNKYHFARFLYYNIRLIDVNGNSYTKNRIEVEFNKELSIIFTLNDKD